MSIVISTNQLITFFLIHHFLCDLFLIE
jgi:hypothetical protein